VWEKNRSVVIVAQNWSTCCYVICMYWTALGRPVANRPSIQKLLDGIKWPSDNQRCFKSFLNAQRVVLCAFVQLLLWIRSVPVSNDSLLWDVPQYDWETRNVTSDGEQSLLLVTETATRPTQLLFHSEIQHYPCIGQQTWTVLDSLPVPKTDAQKLPTCWNCEKTAGNSTHGSAVRVRTHMSAPR